MISKKQFRSGLKKLNLVFNLESISVDRLNLFYGMCRECDPDDFSEAIEDIFNNMPTIFPDSNLGGIINSTIRKLSLRPSEGDKKYDQGSYYIFRSGEWIWDSDRFVW